LCFASCRCILLALLLACSQLALAKHSTEHSANELMQCVLCIGQADSKSASVHTEFCLDIAKGPIGWIKGSRISLIIKDIFQPYQSRAPPFIV